MCAISSSMECPDDIFLTGTFAAGTDVPARRTSERAAEAKAEFLKVPWKYSKLTLPAKLPPNAVALAISALPTQGYVEQTVGDTLTAALTELCALKPKYPLLDTRESAIKFLALYLKAHNPKIRAPHLKHRFGGKLHEYTECCSLVDALLGYEGTRAERAKKGSAVDVSASNSLSEEHERLVAMWDGLPDRKIENFMPPAGKS